MCARLLTRVDPWERLFLLCEVLHPDLTKLWTGSLESGCQMATAGWDNWGKEGRIQEIERRNRVGG